MLEAGSRSARALSALSDFAATPLARALDAFRADLLIVDLFWAPLRWIPLPGVERWLLARLQQPYDLAELSRAFNVSTRTMLRRFAAETDRTPLDFLQQARVTTAKRLLESTDSRVAEVMERVGYLDPGSFRRLFTDEVGVTPAAYRRQFRAAG
jgi:AraC-like DNA-binding protein